MLLQMFRANPQMFRAIPACKKDNLINGPKSIYQSNTGIVYWRYSIHFRLVPHMINLAQQLSIDHKVLTSYNFLWIEFWIGRNFILQELLTSYFSINIDGCMSIEHDKMFSIVINFSEKEMPSVLQHYEYETF